MITIYRTKHCPYCKQVATLCDRLGVEYELISIDDDKPMREKLITKTGHWTVPVTTDGVTYLAGYNISKLLALLRPYAKAK